MFLLNSKVGAFSMIEMLVVMVLSSIVVSMIYFAFDAVSMYQRFLTSKYVQVEGMNEVYSVLTNDFSRSDSIKALNNREIICYLKNSNSSVQYSFFGTVIYRGQGERLDSMACTINAVNSFFKTQATTSGLIDELQVEATLLQGPSTLVFYKVYDAASLVNNLSDLP